MTEVEKNRIIELRAAGRGYKSIADQLAININTVKSFCKREGLTLGKKQMKKCDYCGKRIEIIEKQKPRRFCCDTCRNKWWNSHLDLVQRKAVYKFKCPGCGLMFQVYGNSKRKYCSHECYIKDRFYENKTA